MAPTMHPERIHLLHPEGAELHLHSSSNGGGDNSDSIDSRAGAEGRSLDAGCRLSARTGGCLAMASNSVWRAKIAVIVVLAVAALTMVSMHGGVGGKGGRTEVGTALGLGAIRGSSGSGFPDVRVFFNPSEGQSKPLAAVTQNWDLYHKGGASAITPLKLPDLWKWPAAGNYPEITELIANAHLHEGTEVEYLGFDVNTKDDDKKKSKTPRAISEDHEVFASVSLGHLVAWLEAREAGSKALLISEANNLITNHMGPPEDFDSVIMSFLLKGPEKWDVVFLDKGERGVRQANIRSPYMQFSNTRWSAPYVVYTNHADSEAGAGFYAVSERFLESLPALLRDHRFTVVDGWLSVLCRDEKLRCFSYMQQDWFFGLKAEHLEGHHPPDIREVPTSDFLLAGGVAHGAQHAEGDKTK
mmetsp:Transcript_24139/g.38802  ORF Transcript_24139/g.38802 Transcript_24139/m.38802 type:complete len:414 (-) Transcript_24139:1729-2970(-)